MNDIQPITITLDPTKDIASLNRDAGMAMTLAEAYELDTPETYQMAGRDLQQIKARQKQVEETRKAITRPLDEAKRAVMALFEAPAGFLECAEKLLKAKMLVWSDEQERKQRELQARLEAEASRERECLAAEAAAVQAKAEEEARKLREQAESAAAQGDAARAAKLESKAESRIEAAAEKAEQLKMEAAITTAPIVNVPLTIAKGISAREEWDFEIVDANAVPREYLMIDEKVIRAMVKARKGQTKIPGVRVFSRKNLAARAGG